MSIVFRCPDCNGQLISMDRAPVSCKCDRRLKYAPGYPPTAARGTGSPGARQRSKPRTAPGAARAS